MMLTSCVSISKRLNAGADVPMNASPSDGKQWRAWKVFFLLGWAIGAISFIVSSIHGGGSLMAVAKDGNLYYVNHGVYTPASWSNFVVSSVSYIVSGISLIIAAILGFIDERHRLWIRQRDKSEDDSMGCGCLFVFIFGASLAASAMFKLLHIGPGSYAMD